MKSNAQFIEELKNINPNIEPKENYKGSRAHIRVKCLVCGHEWESMPTNLLRGYGCKKCAIRKIAKERSKDIEDFRDELFSIHPNIELLSGEYINAHTPLEFRCKKCGNEWKMKPNGILCASNGCMICARKERAERRRRTDSEFLNEINKLHLGIMPIEKYINADTPIMFICENGHKFKRSPNNIISRKIITCPICKQSIGEKIVCNTLSKFGIEYSYQHSFSDCKFRYVLPFDFYIKSKKYMY